MTIHYTTTEPLTEAERTALDNFVRSLRQPKPAPSLLEQVSQEFDESRRGQPLADGELDALEYYGTNQHPDPMARALIVRACAELRAARPAPVPPPEHLPSCAGANTPDGCDQSSCPVWVAKERERTRIVSGKWTCSTDEENFDCSEQLDTEADAIEYGKTHCEEMGVEDGALYHTGQILAVDADDLAAGATDAERVLEDIEQHLYDNIGGDHVEAGIGATPAQVVDLDVRLRACVKAWVLAHDLVPDWCRIENSNSHIFHQCAEVDSMKFDPANHPRCIRVLGHEGEHEFP